MTKKFTRSFLATLLAVLFVSGLNAQDVMKRDPNAGKVRPKVSREISKVTPKSSMSETSPMIYYDAGENNMAFFSTTVGDAFSTRTKIANFDNSVQCMEWIDPAGEGNGTIYGIDYGTTGANRFGTINPTTGAFTVIKSSGVQDGVSMAWNPVTDDVYITTWPETTTSTFGKINIATGNFTLIASDLSGVNSIAIDNDGVCYCLQVSRTASRIGTLNLATGAFTQLAASPFNTDFIQSIEIDRGTNKLYWGAVEYPTGGQNYWLEVDKTTGATTTLGRFPAGTHIESFVIMGYDEGSESCPSVTNLTYNVSGTQVTLNWDAVADATSYKVYQNAVEIADINETTYAVSGLGEGNYTFGVAAQFDGQSCTPVRVNTEEITIEYTIDPLNLNVAYNEDCDVVLTWEAPLVAPSTLLWSNETQLTADGSGSLSAFWNNDNVGVYCADDFTAEAGWEISRIATLAFEFNATPLNYLGVKIYKDNAGTPGDQIFSNETLDFVASEGVYIITLDEPIVIAEAGNYWISIYGVYNQPKLTCATYFYYGADATGNYGMKFYNPDNLFGDGSGLTWTAGTSVFGAQAISLVFILEGPEAVPTYTIYKDGVAIEQGIEELTYTIAGEATGEHTYKVESVFAGITETGSVETTIDLGECEVSGIAKNTANQLMITPNPAKDVVRISGNNVSKVEIYNAAGQMVMAPAGNFDSVNVSSLNAGVYFFKVYTTEGKAINQKVIITQ